MRPVARINRRTNLLGTYTHTTARCNVAPVELVHYATPPREAVQAALPALLPTAATWLGVADG